MSVSSEHAVVYWDSPNWCIRDLNSRNGTYVNGSRVTSDQRLVLHRGDELRFAADTRHWTLTCAAEPEPWARHTVRHAWCQGCNQLLLVPSEEHPEASVFLQDSEWVLEQNGTLDVVVDEAKIALPSGTWELHLPEVEAQDRTRSRCEGDPLELSQLTLEFLVSRDEENVDIVLRHQSGSRKLHSKSFYYVLLLLARARMAHRGRDSESGWVRSDELTKMLRVSPEKLNVDIHRARRAFVNAGVLDAGRLVERRRGILRIGIHKLVVKEAC